VRVKPGGKRIEWTGAGGDYFLGVVVSEQGEIAGEFWGTQGEVLAWIDAQQIPAKYVPMALSPTRRRLRRKKNESEGLPQQRKTRKSLP